MPVQIGCYMVSFGNRSVGAALDLLLDIGIEAAEVPCGGFVQSPLCPTRELLEDAAARSRFLDEFRSRDITVAALNANGNPLHPDTEVGPAHAQDLRNAIELAALLGVPRVVAMPGLPGADPGARFTNWPIVPWDSEILDVLDWQWNEIAVPFWQGIGSLAESRGVRVCLEMHPHTVAHNPQTLLRLLDQAGSASLGANLDPSHLFWQGIDPCRAVAMLGQRVFHAAAKDTALHHEAIALNGILDDGFRRPSPSEPNYSLGGRHVLTRPLENRAWRFVTVGRGHDVTFWAEFLASLTRTGQVEAIAIEHEDYSLPPEEGVREAASVLRVARQLATEASRRTND
jgi:sugar phosphate isomerase/epimerase